MIRQTPYNKNNEPKNNSEPSANRALPPSGEPEGASGASFISHSLSLPLQSVSAVLTLLNEGCTIPFISRYRKERTGGLDEVQITDISELYDRLKELGKRKETILKTIHEQEKLTPELEARIRACMDSTELEDIYLPYKPKRRTRAQIAREQGLEPLALAIMEGAQKPTAPPDLPEGGGDKLASILQKYQGRAKESLSSRVRIGTPPLSGRSGGAPLPLSGESEGALALDIIAEIVSENQQARNTVRTAYQRGAVITSKVIKKMKDTDEAQKFADYFDFSEPLRRCNSHRLLAMRRGEDQGILRVSITIDGEECISRLTRQFVRGHGVCQTLVSQAVEDSFKRLINPSIENEFAALSKERADEEAIKVFTENLRQLLLSAPLGQKRVLALDPGFANGCKIACLDEQGNLLHHEIIYPHPPRNQVRQATEALQRMINTYKIEAIAIGNGTASRESKEFVENITTETTAGPSPSPLPHREGSEHRDSPDDLSIINGSQDEITAREKKTSAAYIGNLPGRDYHPLIISTPFTKMLVHKLRAENDAILVGKTTEELEHPQLTVREWSGPNPEKLVLTSHPTREGEYATPAEALSHLYEEKKQCLIVEGGAKTLQSFLDAGLWDEIRIETAPFTVDKGIEAPKLPEKLRITKVEKYVNTIVTYEREQDKTGL